MNRRSFLKTLAVGASALVVPQVVAPEQRFWLLDRTMLWRPDSVSAAPVSDAQYPSAIDAVSLLNKQGLLSKDALNDILDDLFNMPPQNHYMIWGLRPDSDLPVRASFPDARDAAENAIRAINSPRVSGLSQFLTQ